MTNAQLVDRIERETGRRYSIFTVSRYRAAAGLPHPKINNWTAPLRLWASIQDHTM